MPKSSFSVYFGHFSPSFCSYGCAVLLGSGSLFRPSPPVLPKTRKHRPIASPFSGSALTGFCAPPRQNQALVAARSPKGVHAVSHIDGYSETFADLNPQHLTTARQIGIPSCKDRNAATGRADELVYIGDNPYFHVRPLNYSIPYLVPHAATLLEEIGRSFLDSLTLKGYAFQQLVVTSVLRTDADVAQLRTRNRNAAAESAHSYGTTFDISYTHFLPLVAPSQRLRNADPLHPQVHFGRSLARSATKGHLLCEIRGTSILFSHHREIIPGVLTRKSTTYDSPSLSTDKTSSPFR